MAIHAELKTGTPDSVGMSGEALERAASVLQGAVTAGQVSAAALTVARRGTVVLSRGYGRLRPEGDAPAVQPDSIFLLASITKPVTVCALMLLADRGQISLDDPASRYLPDFTDGERGQIRVRHLLSHTSGLPDMLPENIELRRAHAPLSEFLRLVQKTPLLYPPNTGFRYQSMGILLAAEIVERVSGRRLRDVEQEEIFGPLGMKRSALGLGKFQIPETVWCGTSTSETEDQKRFGPNSAYWRDLGNPWGGLHSTAPDLAVLLQTLLNGGEYAGRRVFSAASARAMTTDQNLGLNAPWGLGWALARSKAWNFCGELTSPATFGHTGSLGTVAWADPERDLVWVILTNQMDDNGSLLRRVSNAVSAAVVD
ncbi:MAG: class A beta-lactamase-related serine hydrolase [Candidatus Latescibacteria bacterium]|nr:class A beta-lactamase-related serine hydrolase [Candidatus Latescibacterota bacterium]